MAVEILNGPIKKYEPQMISQLFSFYVLPALRPMNEGDEPFPDARLPPPKITPYEEDVMGMGVFGYWVHSHAFSPSV